MQGVGVAFMISLMQNGFAHGNTTRTFFHGLKVARASSRHVGMDADATLGCKKGEDDEAHCGSRVVVHDVVAGWG